MSDKSKYKRVVGEWVLGKTLGQGSMGKVKLAFNSSSKEKLACKIINRPSDAPDLPKGITMIGPTDQLRDLVLSDQTKKPEITRKDAVDNKRLLREIGVSLLLNHENIVKLKFVFMDAQNYYLFFEYVNGGQLLDFIISHGKLNERMSRKFTRQILSAIKYCHSHSIVHRDLKIENILLDKDGGLKLIDFGLANFIDPFKHLSTFCGSLYFAAPEVLSAKKYIGPEIDMWSLGVILYVLVSGRVPFDDNTLPALHKKIKSGKYDPPARVSPECLDLISILLSVDPKKRASLEDVEKHSWMMKYQDSSKSNYITYISINLPLDPKVLRHMVGLSFGNEKEIKKALETYLKDERSQGVQKWSVGGRTMRCPESPLVSLYNLSLEKYTYSSERKNSVKKTLHIPKPRSNSTFWSFFSGKTPKSSSLDDETSREKESSNNHQIKKVDLTSRISINESEEKSKADGFISADDDSSKRLIARERESIDISRSAAMSKSLDLRRDASQGYSKIKKSNRLRSKTQTDFDREKAKTEKSRSKIFSPSIAAIKSFSSRFFSRKVEDISARNMPGAATLDIKTSYLSGIFTIRNTSPLPVMEIRKELIKAFSRVPNLLVAEQRGYFFCKYFDDDFKEDVYNLKDMQLQSTAQINVKPKVQLEVFIRKIPFSSLHGIQFVKICGDAYKYKKISSQILSMTSL